MLWESSDQLPEHAHIMPFVKMQSICLGSLPSPSFMEQYNASKHSCAKSSFIEPTNKCGTPNFTSIITSVFLFFILKMEQSDNLLCLLSGSLDTTGFISNLLFRSSLSSLSSSTMCVTMLPQSSVSFVGSEFLITNWLTWNCVPLHCMVASIVDCFILSNVENPGSQFFLSINTQVAELGSNFFWSSNCKI